MIVWEKSSNDKKFAREKGRNRFQAEFSMDGLAWNDDATAMLQEMMDVYLSIVKRLMEQGLDSHGIKRRNRSEEARVGFPRKIDWEDYKKIANEVIENRFKFPRTNKYMRDWAKRLKQRNTFRGKTYKVQLLSSPIMSGLLHDNLSMTFKGKKKRAMVRVSVPKQRAGYVAKHNVLDLQGEPLKEYQDAFRDYLKFSVAVHRYKTNKVECGGVAVPGSFFSEKLVKDIMREIRRRLFKKITTMIKVAV